MVSFLAWIGFALLLAVAPAAAHPIAIVAAENFYGDVARQVGGDTVSVHSILTNPDQDPHLFEVSPSVARDVAAARIVIANGIEYDPWMQRLLSAGRSTQRTTIVVAELVGKRPGDNPHIWYDPATMQVFARALADRLGHDDPPHAQDYQRRLARFEDSLKPVEAKIAALRQRLAGKLATATEPVFGPMFAALGMDVRNLAFQMAVMNNTEPGAAQVAAFENDLRTHQVVLLVYNSQASNPITAHMRALAEAAHVPVVGATETEPPGKTYQAWLLDALDAVDRAVAK